MFLYYPAVRAKPGEFAACGRLPPRYQRYVCPRFVVPPPTEADPEKGRVPTLDEIAYMMGDRLGKSWPHRRAFLDPQFAAEALGDEGVTTLFRIATRANSRLLPVLTISDLSNPARRALIRDGDVRAGIYMDFEQVDPAALVETVGEAGLRPAQCILFVDFTGAPLGVDFATNIGGIFDQLGGVAQWNKIVYQASAYPEKLPVGANERTLIARAEWTTFQAALEETGVQPDRLAYGDFGADCGRMVFPNGKGGGRPRPHLRYTGKTHTLVVRGSDSGAFTPTMREVCKQIIESEHYCGRRFSYADDRIWRNAKGMTDTCGDATGWRELNTAHHLVRVVRDLGAMSGIEFEDDALAEYSEQDSLF
ncbi:beta family protein [Roseitalea porphyridii]|nr:beta family protein [Roseitalea porphyridii]